MIRAARGNAPRTRTPTASFGRILPKKRIWPAAPGITPDDIVSCVEIATAGALLALAEKAAGHSHSELGRALGVSRQRVKEIMESGNLEIETMVRVAAACGYELSISLHPVNPDRPVLGAVISADRA